MSNSITYKLLPSKLILTSFKQLVVAPCEKVSSLQYSWNPFSVRSSHTAYVSGYCRLIRSWREAQIAERTNLWCAKNLTK